jgi:hypothetical protein
MVEVLQMSFLFKKLLVKRVMGYALDIQTNFLIQALTTFNA